MYRVQPTDCPNPKCQVMADGLREFEARDLDIRSLKETLVHQLFQIVYAALVIAVLGGSLAMMGIWLFYKLPGAYGVIVMVSTYIAGAMIFVGVIASLGSYYRNTSLTSDHLASLRCLREEEIQVAKRKVRVLEKQARANFKDDMAEQARVGRRNP